MADIYETQLTKQIRKMMNRIEKILVPMNTMTLNEIGPRIEILMKKIQDGIYYQDPNTLKRINLRKKEANLALIEPTLDMIFSHRIVDWINLERDINIAITNNDDNYIIPDKVIQEIEVEKKLQADTLLKLKAKGKLESLEDRNDQPLMPGRWRKEPFPPRKYERINSYVVATGLSQSDVENIDNQLKTTLNGCLGQAYNYDDQGLTEEWMVTFRDESFQASTDDVIRTQIVNLLELMTTQVQDRVCNEIGIVDREPLGLGPSLREAPVWGIDSYTRKMIQLVLRDSHPDATDDKITEFIERKLLPAINAMPANIAHNMTVALNHIIQNEKEDMGDFCQTILKAMIECGNELFRIHAKGTGVICSNPAGIPPHVVIAHYLGELYPPYRWCEKLDVVQQTQEKFGLKPTLPDFYNILLERPRQDPQGYGLLYVDASRRANLGSSCSHSCNANCTSSVVAKDGKLVITLITNRHVYEGEELTMDYYSVTTSDVEWRAAICLCGMSSCRGSFLHYATQDDLQQVLNKNCGPLWRYANLLRSCSNLPLRKDDYAVLDRHGLKSAVFGNNPEKWITKFVADNLKFVEYERKALPCALMRGKDLYTYSAADMDARSVMEQRIQSIVCCISIIKHVLSRQTNDNKTTLPLRVISPMEAAESIWNMLLTIPDLLANHISQMKLDYAMQKAKHLLSGTKENVDSNPVSVKKNSKPKGRSTDSPLFDDEMNDKHESSISLLESVCQTIRQRFIKPETITMSQIRSLCLDIRQDIQSLVEIRSSTARFDQLSDILVLWAYTSNFSTIQAYDAVTSEEVTVYARELGNNIPRLKVFKPEIHSKRKLNALQGTTLDIHAVSIPREYSSHKGNHNIPSIVSSDHEKNHSLTSSSNTIQSHENSHDSANSMTTLKDITIDIDDKNNDDSVAVTDCAESSLSDGISQIDEVNISVPEDTPFDENDDVNTAIIFAKPEKKARTIRRESSVLSGDEPILQASKIYEPRFIFWQLMGWFNAGTDEKTESPDLLGCVELPAPWQCFGTSKSPYGDAQKQSLLKHLQNEKSQCLPWPDALKSSFSETPAISSIKASHPLYGSPMLDVALGKVDGIMKVLETFGDKTSSRGVVDNSQFDNILPPEMPTAWVQCEEENCRKWRRVAWHVDVNSLPDYWTCSMNSWDPENASCKAPQDSYNPDKESTIEYNAVPEKDSTTYTIGIWKDVFCLTNKVYYEAQVVDIRSIPDEAEGKEAKFHFKGWSRCFDEWIEIGCDRIQPHHLFTNPAARRVSDQEKWQGMKRDNPAKEKAEAKKLATTENKSKNSTKGRKRKTTSNSADKPSKQTRLSSNNVPIVEYSSRMFCEDDYADDFAMSDDEK